MKQIGNYLIDSNITIREAMKILDASHSKTLFVVTNKTKLYGALSDGDLRRWILSDGNLNDKVTSVCNKNPIWFQEGSSIDRIKEIMLEKKIQCIPILNKQMEIVELLFWDAIFQDKYERREKKALNIPVVIMAGGYGTRMEPFTKILPKPLIPIGDKTILEIIIDKFLDHHVSNFFISLGHKSKIIKAYMEEQIKSYSIDYIIEEEPLGTIGAISIIADKIEEAVMVTNCDIIIDTDYADFYKFHFDNGYDLSLIGSMMHYKIPYGICEIEQGGQLMELKEKPEYSLLVSTGMYILSKKAISLIPHKQHFHVTHLMEELKKRNMKMGVFPISQNSWVDTGEWTEYHKTLKKMGV
ncbi:MAG: hypothetical protein A2041_09635 [Bacteroidetes bacterium GWA2_31_9b]|nr:MAG: hypothetical protein A2041_09635 [Bacteroidetes bacterium GWA2_31_9b]